MKIFCDTNVFIAAFLTNHPHHHAARPVIERVKAGADEGFLAAHSLAESYAVLTRLAGGNQLAPSVAWQLISENTVKNFSLVTLSARDYTVTLAQAAAEGVEGGKIYDALILAAAAKSGVERVYTFNVSHFQSLADEDLRKRIVAP
jgi:predicted nucleic acid-binding protein